MPSNIIVTLIVHNSKVNNCDKLLELVLSFMRTYKETCSYVADTHTHALRHFNYGPHAMHMRWLWVAPLLLLYHQIKLGVTWYYWTYIISFKNFTYIQSDLYLSCQHLEWQRLYVKNIINIILASLLTCWQVFIHCWKQGDEVLHVTGISETPVALCQKEAMLTLKISISPFWINVSVFSSFIHTCGDVCVFFHQINLTKPDVLWLTSALMLLLRVTSVLVAAPSGERRELEQVKSGFAALSSTFLILISFLCIFDLTFLQLLSFRTILIFVSVINTDRG